MAATRVTAPKERWIRRSVAQPFDWTFSRHDLAKLLHRLEPAQHRSRVLAA